MFVLPAIILWFYVNSWGKDLQVYSHQFSRGNKEGVDCFFGYKCKTPSVFPRQFWFLTGFAGQRETKAFR